MQRVLTKDTIVIVDGLNYIKGYRYQMYCVARELSIRVATVSRHDLCHWSIGDRSTKWRTHVHN